MQRENRPILKSELRKTFLVLRGEIPQHRQRQASASIAERLKDRGRILSFYSIGSEIALSFLNAILASKGCLMSNRLEQGVLIPYHISSEHPLMISRLGIPEPDPTKEKKALLSEIDLILVPGLAFDKVGYRLGYGMGHYDKFLATTGDIPTVGIGYLEQLSVAPLPRDPWDIPVKELILV